MAQISIDVRGEAMTEVPAQRGLVSAAVTADGPHSHEVAEQVAATVAKVHSDLEALVGQGAVRTFSIDQVRVTAHRPWNESGAQLPLVHTASVSVRADFVDFEALGRWVLSDGLTVHGVEWHLDEPTLAATEREMRQAAVRAAVARAQDYSDAIAAGPVRVVAIREPDAAPLPQPRMLRAAAESGPAIDVVAQPLEIRAEVLVSFAAGQ